MAEILENVSFFQRQLVTSTPAARHEYPSNLGRVPQQFGTSPLAISDFKTAYPQARKARSEWFQQRFRNGGFGFGCIITAQNLYQKPCRIRAL